MKNRLLYIDRLKGFAIFLVVIGHIIQNNVVNSNQNAIFELIYSFHMPFFFFLSGYVADKTTQIESANSYFKFLLKKTNTLLIPLFTWPLVTNYFFNSKLDMSVSTFVGIIRTQIQSPSLWFLQALFEIFLVYSIFYVLSRKLNKRESYFSDAALLFLMILIIVAIDIIFEDLNFMSFLLNLGFFFVGVFISKFNFILKVIQNKTVFFGSGVLFMLLAGHYDFSRIDFLAMKVLKVAISLLAIVVFYNLSKVLIFSNRVDDFLCIIGRSTLVIYVSHFMFLSILPKAMLMPADISVILLSVIVMPLSIILIFLCIGIAKIVETMPVLHLLLYGKLTKFS